MGSVGNNTQQNALALLNKLKPLRKNQPDIVQNPIQKWTPDMVKANSINLNIVNEERDKGTYVNADVDKLNTLQSFVNKRAIENLINPTSTHTYDTDTPVAVEYNGTYYLVDGNHRAVASKLLGTKKIRIRVINKE